jgi:hypothetical protein
VTRGLVAASSKTRFVAATARCAPVRMSSRRSSSSVFVGLARLMMAPVSVNQTRPGARRSIVSVPQREVEFTST